MAVIYPFMQGLRESPFPAPGKTVTIKSFIPESGTEVGGGLEGSAAPPGLLQHGEPRPPLGASSTPAAPMGACWSSGWWVGLPGASCPGEMGAISLLVQEESSKQ